MRANSTSWTWAARLPSCAVSSVMVLAAACNSDSAGISDVSSPAVNSADAALGASSSRLPGVVFGTSGMDASLLGAVHTGTLRGGGLTASSIGGVLSAVRSKGGRIVLKLCNGKDSFVKNGDGTFSLTKWKALVDRFRSANLQPFIADGTIVGHYLIDEPQRPSRWGGQIIAPATLEEMARYSKQIWPDMATFARVAPTWLASYSGTYVYLDAGWAQYASGKGSPGTWIAAEVAAAKRKQLGLAVGLNVLDGGDGSSRIRGYSSGRFAMSATEIKTYGAVLLGQPLSCAFFNWMYDGGYYGRSDVQGAMADLSAKARSHPTTSCRQ